MMRFLQTTSAACALTVLIAVALAAGPAAAQELPADFDESFAVTPRQLTAAMVGDAHAITRLHWQRFEVKDLGEATLKARRAVTILDDEGREEGIEVVFYDDKLFKLKKLKGVLRDRNGDVIRKLKKDDLKDLSAISGFSLYEDNRIRVAQLFHHVYPYTVEFEYEVEYDGLLSWPTWYPQQGGLPVEFSQFEIVAPADMTIRYQARNTDLEPEVVASGREQVYRWQVEQVPAYAREPRGPSWREVAMAVQTGPEEFEIEGTRGTMRSWEEFGAWYHALGLGRDELPPEAVAEVQQLVEGAADVEAKARILYRYLQEHTRYVSVQLGLGGWQPFDAEYVVTRGYGDCKALTNYMKALLKAAGVTAYPALISSGPGRRSLVGEFASNQFNHVILYVPRADGEPIWLECTSQTIPFGHIGAGNEDRNALVVTENGGKLIRTPRSRPEDNLQIRHAEVELTEGGSAVATIRTRYTGNQQDYIRGSLVERSARDRQEWLRYSIRIPSFEVLDVDFSSVDARKPEIVLPMKLQLPRYAARTGTRLFLQPNLMERTVSVPDEVEDRTQPVIYGYAYTDVDTVRYTLPEGYIVEAMAAPVDVDTEFGRYEAQTLEEEGRLTYVRRLTIKASEIAPEQYTAYRDFLRSVAQNDQAKVVLVKAPPAQHAKTGGGA